MKAYFDKYITNRQVLILGMGAEGHSTYRFLRKYYPEKEITLADTRDEIRQHQALIHSKTSFKTGADYLKGLDKFDVIIKSPGISLKNLPSDFDSRKLFSQTRFFLELYRNQIIGITGTKGKSTTSSLIHHLLTSSGQKSLLIGNIGVPPFDVIDSIDRETIIVFELSSHQLEGLSISPHIALLLNIYQEHLDHYENFRAYQLAKFNIARWQNASDTLIFNDKDPVLLDLISEFGLKADIRKFGLDSNHNAQFIIQHQQIIKSGNNPATICDLNKTQSLPGKHNALNLLAALNACEAAGVDTLTLSQAIENFKGLEHRLEFVGEFQGKCFYNDSIATIPEAVIFAINTVKNLETLILGGFDRGIDYQQFVKFLGLLPRKNLLFTGAAGRRLMQELNQLFPENHHTEWFDDFTELVKRAIELTPEGKSCLLSPAAASYDQFMNFEHRGRRYKEIIKEWFEAEL